MAYRVDMLTRVPEPQRNTLTRRAPDRDQTGGSTREPGRLLELQQTAGNRAVVQLLEAEAPAVDNAAPGSAAPGSAATAGGAPAPGTHRQIQQGSTGNDVRALQSALNARSDVAQALDLDGIFGPITDRAVRQLQTANPPLVIDGIAGPDTWAVIDAGPGTTDDTQLARKVFQRGSDAFDRADFAHARDFFERAYELAPRPGILFSKGQALRRLGGRREEAIALFEQYLASGDTARAADATRFVAELRGPGATGDTATDDTSAHAAFDRGVALYAANDYAHAYDEFSKAWEIESRPGLVFSRAQCLRRLGARRDEAIALYRQYLETGDTGRVDDATRFIAELQGPGASGDADVDNANARTAFNRGAELYASGDYAHAYDEFTKAGEIEDKPGIVFSRAQALRRLGGRREEAIALFEQYLASGDPTRADDARRHLDELRTQGAEP